MQRAPRPANAAIFLLAGLLDVLEVGRRGKTPGKTLFELEIVSAATGARPTRRQALIRATAMLGVPVIASVAGLIVEWSDYDAGYLDAVIALSMPLAILALLLAAAFASNKRAFWDRLSGTVVRYRR